MKLIVFGATGQLGSRLIDEAIARGHEIIGVARDVSELDSRGGRIDRIAADATEPSSVAASSAGSDAALSAVTQHSRPQVLVDAARGLLERLDLAGVPRLVVAGGAGSLQVASGRRLVDTPEFHDEWKPEALAQSDALAVYRQSDAGVDWSYISPATSVSAPTHRRSS